MKQYIYLALILISFGCFSACKEEVGKDPGNDGRPVVTLHSYAVEPPNSPDNDVLVRVAVNNKTAESFLLVLPTKEQKERIAANGETAYYQYVAEKGKKVDFKSNSLITDILLTDLKGEMAISVAAKNGSSISGSTVNFTGIIWKDVVEGTYHFAKKTANNQGVPAATITGKESVKTLLQVSENNPKFYRLKDLYGKGYSLKLEMTDVKKKDDSGTTYNVFRVPVAKTSGTFKDLGIVSVRDIGFWQNNDALVLEGNFGSAMYPNHDCMIFIQWFVNKGNLGYGIDYFLTDK